MFIKGLRVKRRMHATTLKDLVRNGRSALKEGALIASVVLHSDWNLSGYWREVRVESRMLRQPFLHGRMFVRGVVVSD
jgi:hypothetical protein